MAITYLYTRTSNPNQAGTLSYSWIKGNRSSRVLVSKRPKVYKLLLRQQNLEQYSENVSVKQGEWLSQCGNTVNYASRGRIGSSYSEAYYRAYAKFREQVHAQSKGAIAVDIGERKETIEMITSACTTLAKAAMCVKRGQFSSAARHLKLHFVPKGASLKKTFLDNWMLYRYGVKPMLGSIYSYMKLAERPKYLFGVGRSSIRIVHSTTNRQFTSTKSTIYGKQSVTIKGRCFVESPSLVKLQDLGLINPASVAYNLMTLSFVIDWFVGVGDWLDSWTDFVGLTFDDTAVTQTVIATEFVEATQRIIQVHKIIEPGLWVTLDSKYKVRTLVTSPPHPGLQLGTGLNVKRAIDSIAILTNILRIK